MSKIYFIDFETFWSQDVSLTKMSTPAYILHPKFDVNYLAVMARDESGGDQMRSKAAPKRADVIDLIPDIHNSTVVAHNAAFDVAVLFLHYDLPLPRQIVCTKHMFSFSLGWLARSNLNDAANVLLGVGKDGAGRSALIQSKGMYWREMPGTIQRSIENYCIVDTRLCAGVYDRLMARTRFKAKSIRNAQLKMIDWVVRMAVDPMLVLDKERIDNALVQLNQDRRDLLMKARGVGLTAKILGSNPQFAQWLEDRGVTPPTKTSPTTGKDTLAFSQKDQAFLDLANMKGEVGEGVKIRLAYKADFQRKRLEAYQNYPDGFPWAVGINYSGAVVTGRQSGNDYGGGNPQNLTRKSELRQCIKAPPGHLIVAGDSKQLELRVGLFMAGELDAHGSLAQGEDLYQQTADRYHISRHAGKTVELQLLYGTGGARLQQQLNLSASDGEYFSRFQCDAIVRRYRDERRGVVNSWSLFNPLVYDTTANNYLVPMCMEGYQLSLDRKNIYSTVTLVIPGDRFLYNLLAYNEIHMDNETNEYVYSFQGNYNRKIYPAKVWQNFVQALSYRLIEFQALKIGVRPVLMTHDELVYVIPEDKAESLARHVQQGLSISPPGFEYLCLEGEVGIGETYGDAK